MHISIVINMQQFPFMLTIDWIEIDEIVSTIHAVYRLHTNYQQFCKHICGTLIII